MIAILLLFSPYCEEAQQSTTSECSSANVHNDDIDLAGLLNEVNQTYSHETLLDNGLLHNELVGVQLEENASPFYDNVHPVETVQPSPLPSQDKNFQLSFRVGGDSRHK